MSKLVEGVIEVSIQASQAILDIYQDQTNFQVETKSDASPVTAADLAADQCIREGLANLAPSIPILSEEIVDQVSSEERLSWPRYWLVDPLDGTKEFIAQNDNFTVNIALVEQGQPVLGVVMVPVTGVIYWAVKGQGAYKREAGGDRVLNTRPLNKQSLTVVASRRHGSEALVRLKESFANEFEQVEYFNIGSSLKLCLIAEGKADIYPRLAPTSEWDTAAAQAIVEAAGGEVVDFSLKPLLYNKPDSLLNPWFYVLGDKGFDWTRILL